MMEIFQKSDADGSGALSLPEFQKCCRDADIGLTKKEVQFLMVSCDQDGDGSISYEEFVPLCFEMLTEILKDEMLQERRTPSQLETFLISVELGRRRGSGLHRRARPQGSSGKGRLGTDAPADSQRPG